MFWIPQDNTVQEIINMLKAIVVLLIAGIILYAIFGIWGIILPVVFLVAVVILAIKSANKNPVPEIKTRIITSPQSDTESQDKDIEDIPDYFANFFDAEINTGNIPITIKYQSSGITVRQVNVHKVGIRSTKLESNMLYIRGYCNLRNMELTFKVDRIIEAYKDGKSIDIAAFVNELCQNNDEYIKLMVKQQIEKMVQSDGVISAEARMLTYIERQSGALRKNEKEKIADYLIQQHHLGEIDRDILIEQIAALRTDPAGFRSAAKGIPITDDLLDFAYKLAGNDPMKKGAVEKIVEYQNRQKKVTSQSAAELAKQALDEDAINEKPPLHGLSFCFTGELTSMKRSEAEQKIKELGAYAKATVVKDLSYLVTGDNALDLKNRKAQELGIPVLDEAAFLALLEKANSQL